MYKLIKGKEGKAEFFYYLGNLSSKMPVFYNPKMVVNRDLTNFFLKEIEKTNKIKKAVSLMAGTGVREIRWKLELGIEEVIANDINEKAIKLIKKNSELNKVKINITKKDARFYNELSDFIDLDPFGSPLPFLQPLIKSRFFKVTATDLAVFCTYKKKSLLKYKDFAKKKEFCHIEAIKILIKRIRDFFRMHELAAEPIFSYYYEHHITIFFKKTRKWKKTGFYINDFEFWKEVKIKEYEKLLNEKIILDNKKSLELIKTLKEEFSFKGKYYYLPKIYSKYKIKPIKIKKIIEKGKEIGIKISRSQFDPEIIKTELEKEELIKLLKEIEKSLKE